MIRSPLAGGRGAAGRVPGKCDLRRRRRSGRPAALHRTERRTGAQLAEYHEDEGALARGGRIQGREGQAQSARALIGH